MCRTGIAWIVLRKFLQRQLRGAAWLLGAGLMIGHSSTLLAQRFPSKPIRIVVSEPGGSSDFAARLIVPSVSRGLGQPVIVENRSSDLMSGQIVSGAPSDGYTLLLAGSSFWVAPLLQKLPYDS